MTRDTPGRAAYDHMQPDMLPRNWREYWQRQSYDPHRDAHDCYFSAIAALRLRAVMRGDALPREDEPVDLGLLRTMK